MRREEKGRRELERKRGDEEKGGERQVSEEEKETPTYFNIGNGAI